MSTKENININEENTASATEVSSAVIKRLPRYFRYLRILIREGKMRISSAELSRRMNITASQIRQDLNCFGGFGQQGYGYNVNYLYAKICELLGVGAGFQAIIIGGGNLGRALVKNPMFEKRGVDISAIFDVDKKLVGKDINGIPVYHIDELEAFVLEHKVDLAVLTLPKEDALSMAVRLTKAGIEGIWNFTGQELGALEEDCIVENVHLGDSLMILNYRLANRQNNKKDEK
ncbi:MAG: redox-sensing transcriptional repressor Rex [Clostridia bacterium]|nr:redox-sensing transcriptional repressor Rex [Clostridia bacterium]